MASLPTSINRFVRASEKIQTSLSDVMNQTDPALNTGPVRRLTDWLDNTAGNAILAAYSANLALYVIEAFRLSTAGIVFNDWSDLFSTDLQNRITTIFVPANATIALVDPLFAPPLNILDNANRVLSELDIGNGAGNAVGDFRTAMSITAAPAYPGAPQAAFDDPLADLLDFAEANKL